MIQRDYVMRMVEQFVQALMRVLSLRTEGQIEQARAAIDQAYRSALSCSSEFIESLTAGDIVEMMRTGVFSPEQVLIAARLIEEQDAIAETPLPARLEKSLHLYLSVFTGAGSEALEDYAQRIDPLFDRIPVESLSVYTLMLGLEHYRRIRKYDRAESMLFHAAEHYEHADTVRERGREFYRELREMSDSALVAGGLSLAEVEQGRNDFFALIS